MNYSLSNLLLVALFLFSYHFAQTEPQTDPKGENKPSAEKEDPLSKERTVEVLCKDYQTHEVLKVSQITLDTKKIEAQLSLNPGKYKFKVFIEDYEPLSESIVVPTGTTPFVIERFFIKTFSYRNFIWNLARLESPSSTWNLHLSLVEPPETPVQVGQTVKYRIESNSEGYLVLLNIGSTGNITLLFPNQLNQEFQVPKGSVEFPSTKDGFQIQIKEPIGKEYIIAYLLSSNPFKNELWKNSLKKETFLSQSLQELVEETKEKDAFDLEEQLIKVLPAPSKPADLQQQKPNESEPSLQWTKSVLMYETQKKLK
jgi:hypothetical protein